MLRFNGASRMRFQRHDWRRKRTRLELDIQRMRFLDEIKEFTTLSSIFTRILRNHSTGHPIKTLWYPSAGEDLRPFYYFLNDSHHFNKPVIDEPDLFIFTSLNYIRLAGEMVMQEAFNVPKELKKLGISGDIEICSREVIYHNRSEHPFVNKYCYLVQEDPHEQGKPDGYLVTFTIGKSSTKKTLIYLFHENIHFFDKWIIGSEYFSSNKFQLHTLVCSREGSGDGGCYRSALIHWLEQPEQVRRKHTPKYIVAFHDYTNMKFEVHEEYQNFRLIDRYLPDTYYGGDYNNSVYQSLDQYQPNGDLHGDSYDHRWGSNNELNIIRFWEDEPPHHVDRSFIEHYDWSKWSPREVVRILSLNEVERYAPHLRDDYLSEHFGDLWSPSDWLRSKQRDVDRSELIELLQRRTPPLQDLIDALSLEEIDRYAPHLKDEYIIFKINNKIWALSLDEVERYAPHLKDDYLVFKISNGTPSKDLHLDPTYTDHLIGLMRAREIPLNSFVHQLSLDEVQRHFPHVEDEYIISRLNNDTPQEELSSFEGQGSVYTQALVDMLKRRALDHRFPTARLKTHEELVRVFAENCQHYIFPLLESNLQLALTLFQGCTIRALNLQWTSMKDALLVLKAVTPRVMLQLPPRFDVHTLDPHQLSELRTLKCIEPPEGSLEGVNRLPRLTRLQLEGCSISELEALRSSAIKELVLVGYHLNAPLDLRGLPALQRLVTFDCSPIQAHTVKPVELIINPKNTWG